MDSSRVVALKEGVYVAPWRQTALVTWKLMASRQRSGLAVGTSKRLP